MSGLRRTVLGLALLGTMAPAARAASPLPGPVPDYESVGTVVAHARVPELAPALDRALRGLLGADYVVDRSDPCGTESGIQCNRWPKDGRMLWARDYHPIVTRRSDGGYALVSYLSPNPNRSAYTERTAARLGTPLQTFAEAHHSPLRKLPLLHENGNLIAQGRLLFVSELLIDLNRQPPAIFDPTGTGFVRRTSDATIATFAEALGRRPEDVVVLPAMPAEQSRHVDMFLMALDADTLLVPQIRAEAILASAAGTERTVAFQAASFLDGVASKLQARGLVVERLPMPGPMLVPVYDHPGELQIVYDSPTNALLLPRPRGPRHVMLPIVRGANRTPAFEALRKGYEKLWADFFRKRGYTPHLVDTGGLGERAGLIHCVTATLPPLPDRARAPDTMRHAQNGSLHR
jgi:hypothetical protein